MKNALPLLSWRAQKALFQISFALACVLLGGCASPDFTPYVGEQDWPQGTGSNVQTNYAVPIYFGLPDKPYTVLGRITVSGIHPVIVTRYAKSKGADAVVFRTILTDDAGSYTTPGHATSYTSGGYIGDQYSGFTTTTYTPGVTIPLTVTVSVYDAIKWENPLQVRINLLRYNLNWANVHPDGGYDGEGTDAPYYNAQQVQNLKNGSQEELDELTLPLTTSQLEAKADVWRNTIEWANAHPGGGTYGEGEYAVYLSAQEVQGSKSDDQYQLNALLFRLNQSTQTNASVNSVVSSPVPVSTAQASASNTLDPETAKAAAKLTVWQAGLGGSEALDSETLKTAETAAANGNITLQWLLANTYRDGVGGIQKDPSKAAYWYLRAAKQGDDESQFSLGEMYEGGEGVMQDYVEAYKWFNIAAAAPAPEIDWDIFTNYFSLQKVEALKKQSVPVADKAKAARDQLVQQMTAEQIAEGQRRSAAFVPQTETPTTNSPSTASP